MAANYVNYNKTITIRSDQISHQIRYLTHLDQISHPLPIRYLTPFQSDISDASKNNTYLIKS